MHLAIQVLNLVYRYATAAVPTVQVPVKPELSYQNQKIITIFFAGNEKQQHTHFWSEIQSSGAQMFHIFWN